MPVEQIEVLPATRDQTPIMANLLQLYAHDFSEFVPLDLEPDGRFDYPELPLYWREPGRHPFLIRVDGKLAGFVLVKQGSAISGDESAWDMAEFFVIRRYRRHGVGAEAASQVWQRLPGPWEVRVMESNRPAFLFWERAIASFVGESIHPARIERGGRYWQLFSFVSQRECLGSPRFAKPTWVSFAE